VNRKPPTHASAGVTGFLGRSLITGMLRRRLGRRTRTGSPAEGTGHGSPAPNPDADQRAGKRARCPTAWAGLPR
jgi:hypothetical protein